MKSIFEMTYDELTSLYSECMRACFDLTLSARELTYYEDKAEAVRLCIIENHLS